MGQVVFGLLVFAVGAGTVGSLLLAGSALSVISKSPDGRRRAWCRLRYAAAWLLGLLIFAVGLIGPLTPSTPDEASLIGFALFGGLPFLAVLNAALAREHLLLRLVAWLDSIVIGSWIVVLSADLWIALVSFLPALLFVLWCRMRVGSAA